ncbi:MAG: 2-phosphosulfolactate phosphatase, partial [Rhodospirillaceae bacterium]|nr:2-phosphosulfolactate phosphatase [Rhodospirillaceae bacterium]
AHAVAQALDGAAVIVPAGERWPDGTIRPAIEDWIGAGAIISHCHGTKSPEARLAEAAFQAVADQLEAVLRDGASGQELVSRGYAHDIAPCAALDVSECVPELINGYYRSAP